MKVLMAIDGVAGARRLVPEVRRLLTGQPLEVTLVGVEEVASGLERLVPVAGQLNQEAASETRRGLAEAEALLAEAGIPARATERRGQPGPEILAAAEGLRPDVIVVGAHGFGPVLRAVLGSVSTYVLHHWQGPVLVIREA